MNKFIYYISILLLFSCNNDIAPNGSNVKSHNNVFFYEPRLSYISGEISKKNVYGPPGFGESPLVDRKDVIYILSVDTIINVFHDNNEKYTEDNVADSEYNVSEIQLSKIDSMDNYVGKHVILSGYLYHGISGGHYTKVLMAPIRVNIDSAK